MSFKRSLLRGLSALILCAVFSAACTGLGRQTNHLPGPAVTAIQVNPSTGVTQAPTLSAVATGSTQALEIPGSDWKTYHFDALSARFSYPPTWADKSTGHLEGPDGYAWVESIPNDGAGPGAVCQGEANRGKPDRYGTYPEIRDLMNGSNPACLILPSADQPAGRQSESLYLLWLPADLHPGTLLALHADRNHILALVKSLEVTGGAATAVASHCDFDVAALPKNTYDQNGLHGVEFPVARGANCSPYQEAEAFNQRISEVAIAVQAEQVIQGQWSSARLARLNTRLAPFGYQIQTYDQLFRVVKNGKVLRANISWLGQLTVNAKGTDFLLPILDGYNATTFTVRPDGVHPLENWDMLLYDNIFPVFVGDDLLSLAYDYQDIPRQNDSPALLHVLKNGQVIDTYSVSGTTPARGPVRGFYAWDGHWIIELPGLVIQDGQLLNDSLGYSEMFTWRLLKDKPFYFFRKAGQIQAVYDGKTLPMSYDEVIHDPQWTITLLLELKSYDKGLTFYARRGDVWYYVVMQAS